MMDCRRKTETASKRLGSFLVIGGDSPSAGKLLEALLPDPDRLVAEGEEIHSGRFGGASTTVGVRIGELHLLLKRYNRQNDLYGMKNLLRPSKALRSWRTARRMIELGLPTPDPLLCLEERSFGRLGRSYLVTSFIEGEGNLWNVWPDLSTHARSAAMQALAGLIGRMHRHGILHGDLNWRNILVRGKGEAQEFFLIDLDCCRQKRFGRLPVERDLMHFVRDLRRQKGGELLEKSFLAKWQAGSDMPIPTIRTGEEGQ